MGDEYFYWRCENYDCRAENRIKREKILDSVNKGKSVTIVCGNCGMVNDSEPGAKPEEGPKTWLPCIPFEGSERKLPSGRTPDGWKDYRGMTFSKSNFRKKYKVDPEINWEWRKRGSPKAKD
ncbi:MAG TPA: hypothetical protein PLM24_02585 [Methanothrix sp.]|nr:hypothetical protein [Methanothrix sp.]HPJ84972.1 hypothetical protein [Methanothrix sp.]HPR66005.1 hypothetical protein [Methanothrix sp.]